MSTYSMEIWGGVECTLNRVQDHFFDQLRRSGHITRLNDLNRFAELGLKKLRTGVHWERYAHTQSWQLFDDYLGRMRGVGIEPIAGLVHHGSGPQDTSLLDPAFPERLAEYAGEVARRYPWISAYTPVNEPHTTARFSGLYAHWYPHHRSMRSYVRALFHELKGSVLAMRAISEVRSDAQLIQTEDVGRTTCAPSLRGECAEREQRRWLTFDLLCGAVDEQHASFAFLREQGLDEAEILWFAENPCPPEVLGVNYYVTSDRYLDDRLDMYQGFMRGGDRGTDPLVDIEAVRVDPVGIAGAGAILQDTWNRYHRTVAITEVHLGSDADEQIRWLSEVWGQAQEVRAAGVDCAAICVWSLLGAFDWCDMVRCDAGQYEPGVFDLRGMRGEPRATELAKVVAQLARGEKPEHPALAHPGWWRRPGRELPPWDERLAASDALVAA